MLAFLYRLCIMKISEIQVKGWFAMQETSTITINVADIQVFFVCLLIVAAVIMIVFAIVALFNLIKTLKQSQKVLTDFEVVSEVASKRMKQLDSAIEKQSKKIKTGAGVGGGITSAIPIIVSAITAIAKYASTKTPEKSAKTGSK